ncbi:MAG: leucyl aminopeptidase family protein [Algicola sp.]|nr:leucyl aminopeptidase family protein [Algicola sp.]
MSAILIADNQGTPLTILPKEKYQAWQAEQSPQAQQWLKQTQFKGDGLSLIPSPEGDLSQAVFVCEDPGTYFACGDIIQQLPQTQYLLSADSEYHHAIAFGWAVGSYRFDRYKKNDKVLPVLAIDNSDLVEDVLKQTDATALVRDLVNTPAADMMPQDLGDTTVAMAEKFGAKVSQIIGEELLEQNYPTIHAVGRASCHEPRLIDLHWGDESHPKVTLIGKGVCFDSGGLDLKPAAGMRQMKKDMGGSAHVLGLAQLIMANNLPIRLRMLIPAVENAVSNNAMRPGDVLTTRKGLTVEIDNTDAEGRLVLCDAIAEAENDSPELMVDFATLTGAMRVALGTDLPGFFSTSKEVAAGLMEAGYAVHDPVWQMPLYQPYKALFKSEIADMANCASVGQGGAITAALYLQAFVGKDTDWVHFDIMAFNTRKQSGRPIGGEAFGVRAVFEYLQKRYG